GQLEPRGRDLRARLRRRPGPGGAVPLRRLPARGGDMERLLRGVQALGDVRGRGGAGFLTQPCARSMVARMARLTLIELYPSPWSERLRWALEWKRVPYARRAYQPLAGEEELRRATGLSTVPVLIADLARAVASSPYLVGDGFTRADLTVACMVAGVIGIPPDELFALDESMRAMFGVLPEEDPAVAPLRAWRDGIYRRHRGGRVT